MGTGFTSYLSVVRNPFFKNLSSKCLALILEFFVGSRDFLDTNLATWLLNRACCQENQILDVFQEFIQFIFSFLVSCFTVYNWTRLNHFCEISFLSENKKHSAVNYYRGVATGGSRGPWPPPTLTSKQGYCSL